MDNRDIDFTWKYHNGTKHPGGPLLNPRHQYNPMLNPLPFKIYEDLDPVPLSIDSRLLGIPALSAIAADVYPTVGEQVPDISMMTRILHYSAGITKTLRFAWGQMPFRAAACTGALYHIELYLVCGDLPVLEAGVYHYDPRDSALRRLRKGDYRHVLVDAAGSEATVANAPAILVYTDVFWRNAVKYQAREYRHAFWDSGTIIANTLAVSAACGLPARVVGGFVDEAVNGLLDLDIQREVALALVPVGHATDAVAGPSPEVGPLELKTIPVSDYEIDLPAIREMHEASSLTSQEEVEAWREGTLVTGTTTPSGALVHLEAYNPEEMPQDPLERVITRRGSTRRFSNESITFAELSAILERATRRIPADYLKSQGTPLNHMYLIVNAVEGIQPGVYVFHRDLHVLELIRQGDFRHEAGQLALGQRLAADASVNVYFMADLDPILNRFGNRGYRAAQLEASITAGRVYLTAYALRLGATGLTFYDDAVTSFLSPHAEGKSVMFLVAVGRPARRR
jgi:SagB-type dehydrogenase family enzyme